MRNYLQFQDNLTNNSINNLYLDLKNNFINHKNTLEEHKKTLLNEDSHFIILSNKINSDFNDFNDFNKLDLDKQKLTKQYINIINNSDEMYDKKKNIIYENINKFFMKNNKNIQNLKTIYHYLKNIFYLKNYIYKFINISSNKYNINKFKNNIKKIIHYKNLLDNNLQNSIKNNNNNNNNETINKNNMILFQKKIKNISNIINKNDKLIEKLKSNIDNISDKKQKYYLNILYNNSQNNKKLFGGKLNQYFTKLNNITQNIDKKLNNTTNNINSSKYSELLSYIEKKKSIPHKKYMNHIINLLISLLFNKNNVKLNKVKNLLKKYSNLNYQPKLLT